ncbi:MAG: low specificity L-threonine aldolase [Alphaproteobacteria bacterium]|nr:low specificity L-threonine aldolase [Alphaproteobacteria bacterium]
MNFASDNLAGALPEVMDAVVAAGKGAQAAYGGDEWTKRMDKHLSEVFEREVAVFLVGTGSAANALALSMLAPPIGRIFVHPGAHAQTDECNAPEFFTGGAKLHPVAGEHGKIKADDLEAAIKSVGKDPHWAQPAAMSVTQVNEAGTVYTVDELSALGDVAKRHKLGFHLDGARFANALAAKNASPAEMSWKAGVDILSFGGTKNGCLALEAVVLFDKARAEEMGYRRMRGGHLFSKMRFFSAQMEAYLKGDLWLRTARHSNAMAGRLAEGLVKTPGIEILHAVDANEIFLTLPVKMADGLEAAGVRFYRWTEGPRPMIRLVASFETTQAEVDAVLALARRFS